MARALGIRAGLTCSAACRVTVVATLGKATAKRLGLPRRLAAGTGRITAAKPVTVRVRLAKKAAARLRTVPSLRVTITATATGADGRTTTAASPLTLRAG